MRNNNGGNAGNDTGNSNTRNSNEYERRNSNNTARTTTCERVLLHLQHFNELFVKCRKWGAGVEIRDALTCNASRGRGDYVGVC